MFILIKVFAQLNNLIFCTVYGIFMCICHMNGAYIYLLNFLSLVVLNILMWWKNHCLHSLLFKRVLWLKIAFSHDFCCLVLLYHRHCCLEQGELFSNPNILKLKRDSSSELDQNCVLWTTLIFFFQNYLFFHFKQED